MIGLLLRARTSNSKTGDCPTVWIGRTREESIQSCIGCDLLNGACYAQKGSPAWALSAMQRAGSKTISPKEAIRLMARGARMIRVGAIGDPARVLIDWSDYLRPFVKEGLKIVGYTHFPKERPELRGLFFASADKLSQLREYLGLGWSVTLPVVATAEQFAALQGRTLGGVTVTPCPAQRSRRVSCNSCRLCAVGDSRRIVVFREHGRTSAGIPKVSELNDLLDPVE
jgi:hypothetical protein